MLRPPPEELAQLLDRRLFGAHSMSRPSAACFEGDKMWLCIAKLPVVHQEWSTKLAHVILGISLISQFKWHGP